MGLDPHANENANQHLGKGWRGWGGGVQDSKGSKGIRCWGVILANQKSEALK